MSDWVALFGLKKVQARIFSYELVRSIGRIIFLSFTKTVSLPAWWLYCRFSWGSVGNDR
jgi:branched-subunit amino acid transport protein